MVAKRKGVYKGRRQGTTNGKPDRAVALAARGLRVAEIAKPLALAKERCIGAYEAATRQLVVSRLRITTYK